MTVTHLFSAWIAGLQYCFNLGSNAPLNEAEVFRLKQILGAGFSGDDIFTTSMTPEGIEVVEIGPRISSATPWSTNFVSMCKAVGLEKIVRVERSRRYQLPAGADRAAFIDANHDRMTECVYDTPLVSFETGIVPEATYTIPLLEERADAFLRFEGLDKLSADDRQYYYDHFVGEKNRNPTIVEMQDLLNANSEHSRHGHFKGKQIIDGVTMPQTLMDVVQAPYRQKPGKSLMAFADNSSGVEGFKCRVIIPVHPGQPSPFAWKDLTYHIITTAETHNMPTGVAPFPGAATGSGGMMRDRKAAGRGGILIAMSAGYCVGNLGMPGHDLPWEDLGYVYPSNLALPLDILIQASNGASDYGNKFGEPLISGFTRSFGLTLADGKRWEFLKPIMYAAGIGAIDSRHTLKKEAVKGMLIVQIGGPAYRIGFGGGNASSQMQGDNAAHLDFNAVQRGDGEMARKVNCVLEACIAMGPENPIESIHDQGAGGPANVLKELVEKSGGRVELRRITIGDPTMSVVEIWVCEYQERLGLLISSHNIAVFQAMCAREKVNCEVLGEVTGDGRFVVHDELDGTIPVDLELAKVLGGMPQKTFTDERVRPILVPLKLPEGLTVAEALGRVLLDPAVGSRGFLVRKADRSVGGLVVCQQCCGPLHLPVSDNAIVALDHFGASGGVKAIGEQPIKMLLDPAAGARMAVGEAVTNMASAVVSDPSDIFCSANWMWAAKLPGEGAAMWDAAVAMSDLVTNLGMATPNRGKDSLSMATRVGSDTVKSGRELVIYAYAPMPDVTKHVTPDIKRPGKTSLIHIDVANGKTRLGGSSLAHVYGQIGNDSPDVDDPMMLKRGFEAMQCLIAKQWISAAHDISDGGLITTVLEMAFAGNCGLSVHLDSQDPFGQLFAEELGWVVECTDEDVHDLLAYLAGHGLRATCIGETEEDEQIRVVVGGEVVLDSTLPVLRQQWEETSYRIERLQMNPECAETEKAESFRRTGPKYQVSYVSSKPPKVSQEVWRPKVAILREEGSNGYKEMTSAFYQAGFDPWDVTMTDLLAGRIGLEGFRGLAAVGGFSYADVPSSAKGWAATIRFNSKLKEMFERFYARTDTFSLGVCNGCQLFGLLGVVPWKGISDRDQPRFVHNISRRFESRYPAIGIYESSSIMLRGMAGSVLGVWSAHGEGRLEFPNPELMEQVLKQGLAPVRYVDDDGGVTETYPCNPNGSPAGIAGLCTPDGRHLAMMPHPERAFLNRQLPWVPKELQNDSGFSPWMQMFLNARQWCEDVGK